MNDYELGAIVVCPACGERLVSHLKSAHHPEDGRVWARLPEIIPVDEVQITRTLWRKKRKDAK